MANRMQSLGAALGLAGAILATAQIPAQAADAPAQKPKAAAAAMAKTYATPEEAARALADAVRAEDAAALIAVVGPQSRSWLFTGDRVADREDWRRFLAAYDRKMSIARDGDAKALLNVGEDDWTFPAPIVKRGNRWAFDAEAGREEIINRRVGRNELDTIQTLLAVVDAQREYAAADADRNGYGDYARRFISTPGKKDGLYWKVAAGEPQSPLGPLVGEAAAEGYGKKPAGGKPQPYHGYHYRILTGQGKHAAGGAYDYVVKGKLLGGFAIVAYPAKYGVSGVMTFVVNHDGVVYEKDLGPSTASVAGKMARYDPDKTWRKSSVEP